MIHPSPDSPWMTGLAFDTLFRWLIANGPEHRRLGIVQEWTDAKAGGVRDYHKLILVLTSVLSYEQSQGGCTYAELENGGLYWVGSKRRQAFLRRAVECRLIETAPSGLFRLGSVVIRHALRCHHHRHSGGCRNRHIRPTGQLIANSEYFAL
jgi:hypothetical protein